MPYDPTIFNINPYYDDYDPKRGFLRVLFKPGYALQAREATQLQSILQNQLSSVADHLFKDGSRIAGGAITVKNTQFLMVRTTGSANPLASVTDFSFLVGGYLTLGSGSTSTVAKILHHIDPDLANDNRLVLVVDFLSGSSFGSSSSVTWTQSDTEGDPSTTSVPQTLTLETASWGRGNCKLVSVAEGLFYVDGFFVYSKEQNFSPFREVSNTTVSSGKVRDFEFSAFSLLNKRIGFSVGRDNVTEQEDATLRDPAIGSYNYNAPGADRYKIVLSAAQRDLDDERPDFVELIKFEDGRITKKVERVTYGDIEKALAIRTYDESGSYTVSQNEIRVREGNGNTLSLQIGPGKSYVRGHELENSHTISLELPKARDTDYRAAEGNTYQFSIGLYTGVSVAGAATSFGESFGRYLGQIGGGQSSVIAYSSTNSIVARGSVHGFIPYPQTPLASGVGNIGRQYRMYFNGLSGSIGSGASGFIYYGNGNTLAYIGATSTAPLSNFVLNRGALESQTLVYPLKPANAVDTITSLKVRGKMVSGTDNTTNTYVTISTSGATSSIKVYKSTLTDLSGASDSVYNFPQYTNVSGSANSNIFRHIAFVWSGAGVSSGLAFVPNGANAVLNTGTDANGKFLEFSLPSSQYPSGFTTAGSPIRAFVPVEYTPTIPQDGSAPSDFRYKVSKTVTYTIPSSVATQDTNVNLSTAYGGARKSFPLNKSDVYAIIKVTAVNDSVTPTVETDVTDDFELDDGQRDFYYGTGRIIVKETKDNKSIYTTGSAAVKLRVQFKHFEHKGLESAPFIGKHSYIHSENTGFSYEQIPLFTTLSGRMGTVSLANCLDFRRLTGTKQRIKPYGRTEFSIEGDTQVSYTHWLPRIDKLCVKQNPIDDSAMFYVISGEPDYSPVAPSDPDDGLVLATLTIPAYTHSADDVLITPVDHKRFTMNDIGKIQKRVDEVEVFAKLSISESEISARSLRGTTSAVEPLKTSILVDEFYGHSVADVSDSGHRCSIDYERGILYPFFRTEEIQLSQSVTVPSGLTLTGDGLLMLNYTNKEYISHKKFTKRLKVNPSNTVNWLGFMKLSTSVIPNFDQSYRPVIKTNALMENDNWLSSNANNDRGFGTQFNQWQSIWTGIEDIEEEQDDVQRRMLDLPHSTNDSAVPGWLSGNAKVGVSRKVQSLDQKITSYLRAGRLKNRIKQRIGNRIVDRSVVPYIPLVATITATVRGLKPNASNLILYFDGEPLVTGISTDNNGSCSVNFGISSGTFLTGAKSVRISDSPIVENSQIAADTVLHCTGLLEQKSSGVYSTRPMELRRQTTDSEAIFKDPFNRDIDILNGTQWTDPLSQTFFVDKKTNPGGIFLSSVSLYFSQKDSRLPITLQIRPTSGGYPSPSVVMPFSTVTRLPSQVTANNSSPTATVFTFSSPVYLEPGEYSLCLLTNSDKYRVYATDSSRNGATPSSPTDATDNGRAGNNQLIGSVYYPSGIGTAVEDKATDLMFVANRCDFTQISQSIEYDITNQFTESQALRVYAPEIVPIECSLSRSVTANPGINQRFNNNETAYLPRIPSALGKIKYQLSRGTDKATSPVVDTAAACITAVKMFTVNQPTISTYISRVVELPEGYESTGLYTVLDVRDPYIPISGVTNIQDANRVRVWYRTSEPGEEDLEDSVSPSGIFAKPWREFTLRVKPGANERAVSNSELEYIEYAFRTTTALNRFTKYQIRIDLICETAPIWSRIPSVKNMRAISFLE